jgi:hypothetical protein
MDVAGDQRLNPFQARRISNPHSLDEAQRPVVRDGASPQPAILLQSHATDFEMKGWHGIKHAKPSNSYCASSGLQTQTQTTTKRQSQSTRLKLVRDRDLSNDLLVHQMKGK